MQPLRVSQLAREHESHQSVAPRIPLGRSRFGKLLIELLEQCRHRTACARSSFYLPKKSTATTVKSNLLRMRLTDTENAAVEDGVSG